MARLIIANLDAEADFAALSSKRPRLTLRRAAREVAAEAGTLLRAFARDEDTLCLPALIERSRLSPAPGLSRPSLLASVPPPSTSPVLAWARTPAVERCGAIGTDQDAWRDEDRPLHEILWSMPVAPATMATACNDRQLALTLGQQLGSAAPTACLVASVESIVDAASRVDGPWVVKARFSAAGRLRVIHRGGVIQRERLARLLSLHGSLVFEPWAERLLDVGISALLGPCGGFRLVSFHRQVVDRDGRFRGLETEARFAGIVDLRPAERDRMLEAVEEVASALHARGYVGPFGIDAWRFRTSAGEEGFQPLGEINARMTFGLVARTLIDRLRVSRGWRNQRVALRFGPSIPERGLALLHPVGHPEGGGAIWLEVE